MSDPSDNVTLREFIERILDEREAKLKLTAEVLETRLHNLNEWRAQAIKDRDDFVRKEVYDQRHEPIERRLDALERSQSRLVGIGVVILPVSAFIGAVITVVAQHVWK